ncbi:unnamed protein product [Nezara viridula]|uniref:Hairy n=1 Tax=Nezara viridula TaxID=85310 RepID=A0A9P0MV20_NEZVI|nr:unnamed protein product [Nezara viridula]
MPDIMAAHRHSLSKAELRKSNKPIMEKRRRARINQCLDELKSLILEAMKKDPARHAKLEKADILEMTVKHLQDLQRHQMRSAVSADPSVISKFHSGFNECATEVSRYVSTIDGVDDGVRRRLLGHLTGCLSGLNQVIPLASARLPGDVNNNGHRSAFVAVSRHSPPASPGSELSVQVPEPLPSPSPLVPGLLMQVPRPSTSTGADMWRPW